MKAFEIYGNPLPDIVDLRIERIDLHSGEWICRDLSGIAECWYNVPMNGATWLVLVGLLGPVLLRP